MAAYESYNWFVSLPFFFCFATWSDDDCLRAGGFGHPVSRFCPRGRDAPGGDDPGRGRNQDGHARGSEPPGRPDPDRSMSVREGAQPIY
eukprot:9457649-Lingulodinium_polyedra.AAC.1